MVLAAAVATVLILAAVLEQARLVELAVPEVMVAFQRSQDLPTLVAAVPGAVARQAEAAAAEGVPVRPRPLWLEQLIQVEAVVAHMPPLRLQE
jgi:hypothetical protein